MVCKNFCFHHCSLEAFGNEFFQTLRVNNASVTLVQWGMPSGNTSLQPTRSSTGTQTPCCSRDSLSNSRSKSKSHNKSKMRTRILPWYLRKKPQMSTTAKVSLIFLAGRKPRERRRTCSTVELYAMLYKSYCAKIVSNTQAFQLAHFIQVVAFTLEKYSRTTVNIITIEFLWFWK